MRNALCNQLPMWYMKKPHSSLDLRLLCFAFLIFQLILVDFINFSCKV